jgi:hypothetical protein
MAGARNKSVRRLMRRASRRRAGGGSEVVQLRPAWADSVLLYWGSPVAYESSGLDDDLVAGLQSWDAAYYHRVGSDAEWRSQAAADAHRSEGLGLAQKLAEALGSGFVVEFDERLVRSPRPPTSPAAAAAFKAHGHGQEVELHWLLNQLADDAGHDEPAAMSEDKPAQKPGQWLREVRADTTRRVRVIISPDLSVGFPVEVVVNGKPGYVDGAMLGITAALRQDLEAFQDWWEQHTWDGDEVVTDASEDAEWAEWNRQGYRLVERLQSELGEDYHVTWN